MTTPLPRAAPPSLLRLGIYTGVGHGELIQKHFGRFWAWVSVATLVIACTGALVSEMSGVVGIGNLFGVPPAASACSAAVLLMLIVMSGKYRHVERVALVLGCCEFTYLITMFLTFSPKGFRTSVWRLEFSSASYNFLVAANIGAVVMPWMIFYHVGGLRCRPSLSPFFLNPLEGEYKAVRNFNFTLIFYNRAGTL